MLSRPSSSEPVDRAGHQREGAMRVSSSAAFRKISPSQNPPRCASAWYRRARDRPWHRRGIARSRVLDPAQAAVSLRPPELGPVLVCLEVQARGLVDLLGGLRDLGEHRQRVAAQLRRQRRQRPSYVRMLATAAT
jgi:hypothetical protein